MYSGSHKGGSQLNCSGFKCRNVTGAAFAGEVVFSKEAINFYLVDPESGKIIEEGHSLEGTKIGEKILIFPGDKGSSVVQLDGLYLAAVNGQKPKGFIVQEMSTVLVSNAIIMEIPLVIDAAEGFYQAVQNGDWIEIESDTIKISHFCPK